MTLRKQQSVYTLVVGLGKTGLSVIRYLSALGENIIVADSRDIPPGVSELARDFPDVQLHTGAFNELLFTRAHRIIVSPGVPLSTPVLQQAKKTGIEICGDIDLFTHEVEVPVVGITGSNGKSTVTTLLTQMANDANHTAIAGGNIGLPVLDMLAQQSVEKQDLYILELSSFQLETLHHLPMKAAVVLNISADHLDRYEDITAYAVSKQVIYDNAEILVVNRDDALALPASTVNKSVVEFTMHEPEQSQFGLRAVNGKMFICHGTNALIDIDEVRLKGRHNIQNVLAALALGSAIDLPMDCMLETLKKFSGLPHRTQWVTEFDGVNWFNDSKATNEGAAIAAIEGLPGRHVLIAGGEAKGADFSELAETILKNCRAVVLLGKDASILESAIEKALNDSSTTLSVKRVIDMRAAVLAASHLAEKGDNVLLAPACASFDMFSGFEDRGNVFMQEVVRLSRLGQGGIHQ